MRDAVEERPDIEIDDPVVAPAARSARPDRVQRAASRPVPVAVWVEQRFHLTLQVASHDGLRDPVRDRRHPEDALP